MIRLIRKALRRAALPVPQQDAHTGLVAVFWKGSTGVSCPMWPDWPMPGGHNWVGVFERADGRCLVVAQRGHPSGLMGEKFVAACAADIAALGYEPASNWFSPAGPWGAVAFEVTATPAAGLPDDLSKMPYRPAPVPLPEFA
jgi:hypothetical protein